MTKYYFLFLFLLLAGTGYGEVVEYSFDANSELISSIEINEIASEDAHHHAPAWSVIPFALLLIMIATGPLFYEHFWHKNYPIVACVLAGIVVSYYLFGLHNQHAPVHALFEYVQFIALLSGLFIASGGIMINVDKEAKPLTNVALLLIGAMVANVIGTTGASMLLIRPFIRLNKNRTAVVKCNITAVCYDIWISIL